MNGNDEVLVIDETFLRFFVPFCGHLKSTKQKAIPFRKSLFVLACDLRGGHGRADFRHLSAAFGAQTLNGGLAVLHFDLMRIFHLALGFALDTISFHNFRFSLKWFLQLARLEKLDDFSAWAFDKRNDRFQTQFGEHIRRIRLHRHFRSSFARAFNSSGAIVGSKAQMKNRRFARMRGRYFSLEEFEVVSIAAIEHRRTSRRCLPLQFKRETQTFAIESHRFFPICRPNRHMMESAARNHLVFHVPTILTPKSNHVVVALHLRHRVGVFRFFQVRFEFGDLG